MKKFYLVMIILLFIGAIISFIQGDYTMCVGTSATGLSCIKNDVCKTKRKTNSRRYIENFR